MKKLHLILLSLLAVSLITYCPASSSGNPPPVDNTMRPPVDNMMPPPVDNTMQPPTDITTAKTIHAHVNDNVADDTTVVALADSITVAEPTYSILEGNDDNIFSIDSSTGVISLADASKVTYDAADKTNNIHLLKVRARDGSDSSKATEAPLRIVVRGENGAFITTWKTTGTDETITIPIFTSSLSYNFAVKWGDGETTTYMDMGSAIIAATHEYTTADTYTVIITGTLFPRIYLLAASDADKTKIQTVEQWGSNAWTSMQGAFDGASNLTVPAVDAPNLTGVTDMQSMFENATSFNQEINHWDTSNIEDMGSMFNNASAFNQNIGDWNTAMVTDMNGMFNNASAFNQNIGAWNTEKVTDMSGTFRNALAFNQDIGSWNTEKVTDMNLMLAGASAFNQDISSWNTAMVTNMNNMFFNAELFNQSLKDWNVGAVTTCSGFTGGNSGLTDSNRPDFTTSTCTP